MLWHSAVLLQLLIQPRAGTEVTTITKCDNAGLAILGILKLEAGNSVNFILLKVCPFVSVGMLLLLHLLKLFECDSGHGYILGI